MNTLKPFLNDDKFEEENNSIENTIAYENAEKDAQVFSLALSKMFEELQAHKEQYNQGKSLDLMIIMDCTGSMKTWMMICHKEIKNIVEKIKKGQAGAKIRVSFIGYRDFSDGPKQSCVLNFTENLEDVINFIKKQRATGGGDPPEDVAGGLENGLSQNWESEAKYVIFVSDSPAHGQAYHEMAKGIDNYPEGDPLGRKIEDLMEKYGKCGVDFYAVKMNTLNDKMFKIMSKHYKIASGKELNIVDLGNCIESFPEFVAKTAENTLSKTKTTKGNRSVELIVEKSSEYRLSQIDFEKMNIEDESQQKPSIIKESQSHAGISELSLNFTEESSSDKNEAQDLIINVEKSPPPSNWNELGKEALPAIAYTWFIVKDKDVIIDWKNPLIQTSQITTKVRISDSCFSEGAMRYAFYMQDIDLEQKMVAKLPKRLSQRNYNISSMRKEIESVIVCQHIVDEFNDRVVSLVADTSLLFSFVHSFVYEITKSDYGFRYWWAENYIDGCYEKFNNNAGWTSTSHSNVVNLAQAFSHFSWQYTKGYLLIVDLQGTARALTDPQIHCVDEKKFGSGNFGFKGMLNFFASHVCNDFCKKLRLLEPKYHNSIPKDFDFFLNLPKQPLDPQERLSKLCDLCRKPFQIKAGFHYQLKMEHPEVYCNSCESNRKNSMKAGKCVDCSKYFKSSVYWFKLKRTDFPERCSLCRLANRKRLRIALGE